MLAHASNSPAGLPAVADNPDPSSVFLPLFAIVFAYFCKIQTLAISPTKAEIQLDSSLYSQHILLLRLKTLSQGFILL